jgi:hypothetical protein
MITITLQRDDGTEITLPAEGEHSVKREIGPDNRIADICLEGQVMIGCPIGVEILLRTDGSWAHWGTSYAANNHYLHIRPTGNGITEVVETTSPSGAKVFTHREKLPEPTEAQRETVARWYLDRESRPYGMPLGGSLCSWAFQGIDAQEVSRRYGSGQRIYLAGHGAPVD